jgi:hypothetical protein
MKTLRLWLSYLAAAPFRLLGHVFFRLMGHSRLRVGTLTFWGPRDFLESCTASVRRLQELDADLFTRLTTQQRLEFYYSPKHLEQAYFVWLFSIDDSYTAWHSDGIIARLVYSAQLATLIPRRVVTKAMSRALHSEVNATTRLWLETRHFPEPLVHAFREQTV